MSQELAHTSNTDLAAADSLPPALRLPAGVAAKPLQAGKIRAGEKDAQRGFPKALDKFRFTHPDRDVIEAVAEVYGGTVEEWNDPKARPAHQWQVTTEANIVDVIVATSGSFSCTYEAWTEAGISMRTDGRVNLVTGELLADPCPDDQRGAQEWVERHGLKLTTRMTVMPMDIQGLSEWMVETHGWIPTATFADAAEKMLHFARAGVSHVPARLTLTPAQGQTHLTRAGDIEKAKKAGKRAGYRQLADGAWVQKSNFVLLGLDIVTKTPRQMFSLAQETAQRVAELEGARLELAAGEEREHHAQMAAKQGRTHEQNRFDGEDPMGLNVAAGPAKTQLVDAFKAAGNPDPIEAAKAAWGDRGSSSIDAAELEELLKAASVPVEDTGSDDDVAEAEIIDDDVDQGEFAIDQDEVA